MAFKDLLGKLEGANLYDVKDAYNRVKILSENPEDIIDEAKRRAIDKIMRYPLIEKQLPQYKLPLKLEIDDLRDLSIDQADSSFSVKLNTFRKVTSSNEAGQSEQVKNLVVGSTILPQPQNIVVSYPKNWGAEAGGGSLASIAGGDFMGAAKRAGGDALNNIGGLAPRSAVDYKSANRINHNDRLKVLFQDVPFRTFDLSFVVWPKRKEDQAQIQKFITFMKRVSAPSTAHGGAAWIFPETFQMDFTNGHGNPLFKTLEIACTNFTVNYTPNGVWSQHKEDGSPVAIQIDMSFQELELITKDKIDAGV